VSHPEKVLGESLIAHDKPPKVLEPGQESLDLPAAEVATQRTTVLSPLCPDPPVRRDQFHATTGQVHIQPVRLVGVVADETHGEMSDKFLRECCV
jgi:hypothetical protein